MTDKLITDLTAIADANISGAALLEVQRTGNDSEKMTLTQMFDKMGGGGAWPYLSGNYYEPDGLGADFVSTSTMGNGALYAVIGYLMNDVTIVNLAMKTTATVNAAGNARLALASVDPANMKPLTKLCETGNFGVGTANTAYEAAITGGAVLIPCGFVAGLCMVDQSTTAIAPQISLANNAIMAQRIGASALAGIFSTNGRAGWSVGGQTFGTIPSDLSVLSWVEDTAARGAKVKFKVN